MADEKRGANHVRGMLARGADELRAMSFWEGSNVAQPNHPAYYYGPPGDRAPSAFERAVEDSRRVPGPEFQNQHERPHGRERAGGRER